MDLSFLDTPTLVATLALAAGLLAHTAAHHLRVPGIVLLLFTGVILGPDVLNLVRPEALGPGMEELVALSVAVILFEGGLNLSMDRLRREGKVIRRLVTVGAVLTGGLATLVARLSMDWSWSVSMLFGTLVIVTGPTVITPLVRRIRLKNPIATILEAEGVLIDPIGAIIAVVALEEVLAFETTAGAGSALVDIPIRLAFGGGMGVLTGLIIGFLLARGRLVPDGLRNVLTLGLALAFFELTNALVHESGLMQAATAGIVVGNLKSSPAEELREFKEQLTVMLLGMLFVALAANVRLSDVAALGGRAAIVIVLLMFLVRPIVIAVCTHRSGLSLREKIFLSWLSPRGIVAAGVAALFAIRLDEAGLPGGAELQAMVFLVIAATVVIQGLSGSYIARRLDLQLPSDNGYVIAGAHALSRALGRALMEAGHDVVLIDTNDRHTRSAKAEGLQVVFGNAGDESVLRRVDVDGRAAFIAITQNPGVNLLLADTVKVEYKCPVRLVATLRNQALVSSRAVVGKGHRILFGREVDVDWWIHRLQDGDGATAQWRWTADADDSAEDPGGAFRERPRASARFLGMTVTRAGATRPIDDRTALRRGDTVAVAYPAGQEAAVSERLAEAGWTRIDS